MLKLNIENTLQFKTLKLELILTLKCKNNSFVIDVDFSAPPKKNENHYDKLVRFIHFF